MNDEGDVMNRLAEKVSNSDNSNGITDTRFKLGDSFYVYDHHEQRVYVITSRTESQFNRI